MLEETRTRFAAAVKDHGGVLKVARLLECSPQFVYVLINGADDKKPGLRLAIRIRDTLGIELEAWTLPSGKKRHACATCQGSGAVLIDNKGVITPAPPEAA